MFPNIIKFALITGAAGGFLAGKLDLDVKIAEAIRNSRKRLMVESARTLVDELENRKVVTPIG
jgi:hypothetical protein